MAIDVHRNDEASRYEILVDGSFAGFADFRIDGDTVVMPHTVINPEMRGRGLGDHLVRGALDDIRHDGRRVDPRCWFVREYIEANEAYADLMA